MDISARLLPFSIFVVSILHLLLYPSVTGSEVSMVAHPATVWISSANQSEQSPTSRPGTSLVVRRVHIHGLSRFRNLAKYAHSWKLKVEFAKTTPGVHPQNVEICFHRNVSLEMGNYSPGEWEKLKGSWIRSIYLLVINVWTYGCSVGPQCLLKYPLKKVGIGSFLLHYVSGLLRSALVEIGLREDMLNP